MPLKNGIMEAPVGVADVASALGSLSTDVATLCTDVNINPAALCVPRYTYDNPGLELDTAGFAELAAKTRPPNGSTTGWACPNWGVWVPDFNLRNITPSNFSSIFDASRKTWYIARPDDDSFKCLHHFVGYKKDAKVTNPIISASASKLSNGFRLTMMLSTPPADGMTLSISNVFGGKVLNKDWYFGVIVFRGTNSEGWTQSDTVLIKGAGTAIPKSSTEDSAFTITIDDTEADNSKDYVYRIIPFICDKANVTNGSTDFESYSLRMNSTVEYYRTVAVNGAPQTTEGQPGNSGSVIPGFAYFRWSENTTTASGGHAYPDDNRTAVPSVSGYKSDIAIAYCEKTIEKPWEYYDRIDLTFYGYLSDGTPQSMAFVWRKDGNYSSDDNKLYRDSSKDSQMAYKYTMLFMAGPLWKNTGGLLHSCNDCLGKFYYTDSLGYKKEEEFFATWIPDDYVETT